MHKKLFRCGNGMAVIIDAHFRRLLGLDENTLLHVVREGSRIVIEKSVCDRRAEIEPVVFTTTTYHPRLLAKLLMELDRAGLDRARFRRLSTSTRELFSLHSDVQFGKSVDALTVHRLQACLDKLKYGVGWDAAIAEVVDEIRGVSGASMLVPSESAVTGTT